MLEGENKPMPAPVHYTEVTTVNLVQIPTNSRIRRPHNSFKVASLSEELNC